MDLGSDSFQRRFLDFVDLVTEANSHSLKKKDD